MVIRVLTDTNFLDVFLKEKIDVSALIQAIDNTSTILLETKDNTKVFINTINIVAIEVFDTPPIQKKE